MATPPRKSQAADRARQRRAGAVMQEIATTRDGRDITKPYIGLLQEPRNPRLMQSVDWGVYAEVLRDPEVYSTFQQRRRALTSAEWDVEAGDEEDPRSVEAAEKLKANLERIGLDRITDRMLYVVPHGYAVAEVLWGHRDGMLQFEQIKVRNARRFRKDKDDRIRLLTLANMTGEIMPDRKFWWVTTGGSDDDEPYGEGFCDILYWPTLFKRGGIGFWNTFLDKFGTPTAMGTYRRGTPADDIRKLLDAVGAIATDSGFVIPEGMTVALLEAAKSGGDGGFEKLIRYCDETIAKVVLSQTMTTSDGASRSQAEVHAGVKVEVVTGDDDLLSESFNNGPARWWTDFNYGEDVASPKLYRLLDEEEDTKTTAETDGHLATIGWVRTKESFRDIYGDGFERKAPAAAPEAIGPDGKPVPAPDQPGVAPKMAEADAQPEGDNVVPLRKGAASFAELIRERDAIDGAVDELLARDGWEALAPIVAPIADAVMKSGSADELDESLIRSLDQSDVDRLTTAIARAGFAVRVAAETGADTATVGE